jgi:hypothetical protein
VGEETDDILYWQKEAQQRIKQLEEKDDNTTILNEDEQVTETIKIKFDSDFSGIEKRVWASDSFYLDDDGGATRNQMLDDGTGPVMYDNVADAATITYLYPLSDTRVEEDGTDVRITEGGDTRITEGSASLNTTGVVTNYAMNLSRSNFITEWQSAITHIATGDDTTAPTVSDTALGNETLIESTFEEFNTGTFVSIAMFQDTADNNGNTIAEVGLFDAASGGNCYQRSLTNSISKTSTVEAYIEVKTNVQVENTTTLNT